MEFRDIGDLVNRVNGALGEFCNEFGRRRKELAGLGKVPTRGILFKFTDPNREWAINEGGGTEIQYHIAFNEAKLIVRYGLGFNTQYVPYANQMTTVEYMLPYMIGFLKQQQLIKQIMPHYAFVYGDLEQLRKPNDDEYTLFGRVIDVKPKADQFFMSDDIFNELINDLKKQIEPYEIIFNEKNTLKKVAMNSQNILSVLSQKGQIILQGPPGTGKTRQAKLIGRELVLPVSITKEDIQRTLKIGDVLKSATEYTEYTVSKIDASKVTVRLKEGTEYSPSFKEIIKAYETRLWEGGQKNGNAPYSAAIAKYIFEHLDCSQYLKIIQFHPAFSYEDFVRGIVAESRGNQIDYITRDKVLMKIADDAYNNWKAANEPREKVAKETWVRETLEEFRDFLSDEIEDEEKRIMITRKVYINRITENSIRYNSDSWVADGGVPVSDIIKMYLANTTTRKQIKESPELTKTAKSLATYWFKILEEFNKYITLNMLKPPETTAPITENKYVLIIDEINRANLPAVLGELIYALEYRGERVDSMYAIDDDPTLVIPPNLFIIGTMNTSDRSVGHIDYAIRRRFAFIEVLPKVLEGDRFELEFFKKVSALFIQNFDEYEKDNSVELQLSEYLSEEFRPEDVWLGHSYFIKGDGDFDLRKKYEIVPILKEYVKDGILKQSAEPIINAL